MIFCTLQIPKIKIFYIKTRVTLDTILIPVHSLILVTVYFGGNKYRMRQSARVMNIIMVVWARQGKGRKIRCALYETIGIGLWFPCSVI